MKTLEVIHGKIHGLRMIPKYNPSKFERDVNILISKEFEKSCEECKFKLKQIEAENEAKKYQPQQTQGGFLSRVFS